MGCPRHPLFWMMVSSSSVPLSLKLAQVWKSLAKPTRPVTSRAILSVTLFMSSSVPGGMLAMLAMTLSRMAMTSGKPFLHQHACDSYNTLRTQANLNMIVCHMVGLQTFSLTIMRL